MKKADIVTGIAIVICGVPGAVWIIDSAMLFY